MLIGVATTIAKEHKYDALKACEFAEENGFGLVQFYFKEEYLKDKDYIKKLHKRDVFLIGHSDSLMNGKINDSELEFFKQALDKEKIVVFHHAKGDNVLSNIEKVRKAGLWVGLENTYDSEETREDFLKSIQNSGVIPVLDLKRYLRKDALKKFYFDLEFVKNNFVRFVIHFEDMDGQPIKEIMQKVKKTEPSIVVVENDGIEKCKKALNLLN